MRIRPFFWLLLAVCCIGVLSFAATIQEHVPALLHIQLAQQQSKANSITAVELHLTDEQGLPLDAAHIDSRAEMTNMPMSTNRRSVRYLGQGTYLAQFRLYMAGPWAITFQALLVGAVGYIVKKAAPTELHMAIKAVAHGGAFLYPGLAKALIHAFVAQPAITPVTELPQTAKLAQELQVLTPREMEVLRLVAEGRTNQEIADQLVVSIKTVQSHRANVMEKLDLQDITHLVRFAIRHKLISEDA